MRSFLRRLGAVFAGVLFCLIAIAWPPEPGAPVRGTLVIKGKSLIVSHAWLVRGPDTSDETKPSAYLILSSQDISAPIAACKDVKCVIWHAVTEGAVLQPLDDGHDSFWLRVLSPDLPREEQLSGRRWLPSIDRHDRLSGKLQFHYSNTQDEADLEIDAALLKEFPVRP